MTVTTGKKNGVSVPIYQTVSASITGELCPGAGYLHIWGRNK